MISVQNVSKLYRIGKRDRLPDTLFGAMRSIAATPWRRYRTLRDQNIGRSEQDDTNETLWALRDVSFDVMPGDVLGIIGRNGAGKSTLLKILSQVTSPTYGQVELNGRVSSLLEVGTGFHPELTGRENVYMNGTILGMTKTEIDGRFEAIVDFSGIEKFIDTPTKRYSSGMQMRLAFAVAAHLEPEIMIVDEVLAVGDAKFQARCISKMKETAESGRTVLFVTHNLSLAKQFCTSAIVLSEGKIITTGSVDKSIAAYHAMDADQSSLGLRSRLNRTGMGRYRFSEVLVHGKEGVDTPCSCGEAFRFCVTLERNPNRLQSNSKVNVAIVFKNQSGLILTTLSTHFVNSGTELAGQSMQVQFSGERTPFVPGIYYIDLWCGDDDGDQDFVHDAAQIEIAAGCFFDQTDDLRLPDAKLHGSVMIPYETAVMHL